MVKLKAISRGMRTRGGSCLWVPNQWQNCADFLGHEINPQAWPPPALCTRSAVHFYTGDSYEVAVMKARIFRRNHALDGLNCLWHCETDGTVAIHPDKAGAYKMRITEKYTEICVTQEYFLMVAFSWWLLRTAFSDNHALRVEGEPAALSPWRTEQMTYPLVDPESGSAVLGNLREATDSIWGIWRETKLPPAHYNAPWVFDEATDPTRLTLYAILGAGAHLMHGRHTAGIRLNAKLRANFPWVPRIPNWLYDYMSHEQMDAKVAGFIAYLKLKGFEGRENE